MKGTRPKWGWGRDEGCGPCQAPTGPGESIRLDWNPLESTFDLLNKE
jgi:hypothetical protein